MSDKPTGVPLSAAEIESVAGGCTAAEIVKLTDELIKAYENLVDFTSHVIERVAG